MSVVFNTFLHAVIERMNVTYLFAEQSHVFGLGSAFCLEETAWMFKQILLLCRHLCVTSALAKQYLNLK